MSQWFNLIGNTCIPSWITTNCLHQQLVNPFTWCIMDFESSYNLVKYFDTINFGKFRIEHDSKLNFYICVDDKVNIQYVHYHFKADADSIQVKVNDVYYKRIWEFIVDKYITRCKRMISLGIKPIFLFASAPIKRQTCQFTVEQQRKLYDIDTPYRIYQSFANIYPHTNSIKQTQLFPNNGMQLASYIFNQIKGQLVV